jgi:uncharacterized protein with PIN domain
MRQFRLIFTRDVVVLERRTKNGAMCVQELSLDKIEQDAKLLDQLLSNLNRSKDTEK